MRQLVSQIIFGKVGTYMYVGGYYNNQTLPEIKLSPKTKPSYIIHYSIYRNSLHFCT